MAEKIIDYTIEYTSQLIRGRDITPRPKLAANLAVNYGGQNKAWLDVGCGTAYKILPLVNNFKTIIGLDPSSALLDFAQSAINSQKIINFHLIKGIGESLPFKNERFDVVTSILSWWHASEVDRVLNSSGTFIVECLGANDKKDLTQYFGKDQQGWRGANLNTCADEIQLSIKKKLMSFFNTIIFFDVLWKTSYIKEGLWLLLNNTKSTVRHFDPIKDKAKYNNAMNELAVNNEIVLTQNRIIAIATR